MLYLSLFVVQKDADLVRRVGELDVCARLVTEGTLFPEGKGDVVSFDVSTYYESMVPFQCIQSEPIIVVSYLSLKLRNQ